MNAVQEKTLDGRGALHFEKVLQAQADEGTSCAVAGSNREGYT